MNKEFNSEVDLKQFINDNNINPKSVRTGMRDVRSEPVIILDYEIK
jgi:hypothetical protein